MILILTFSHSSCQSGGAKSGERPKKKMSCGGTSGPMPKKMYTDVSSSGLRRCKVYGWHKHKSLGVFAQFVCRVRSQHRRLSRTLLMATTPSTRQGPRLALGSSQSKWVGEPDYLDPLLGARLTYLVFRRDQRVVPCHEPFIPVIVIIITHLAMN